MKISKTIRRCYFMEKLTVYKSISPNLNTFRDLNINRMFAFAGLTAEHLFGRILAELVTGVWGLCRRLQLT